MLRTLIGGVVIIEKPIHASLCPHEDNIFGTTQCFPQLLIESALQQQLNSIQFNSIR
jgi:hypothetical protein